MLRRWLNNLSIAEKVLFAPLLLLSALAVLGYIGWSIVTSQAAMYRTAMIQHQAMTVQFVELPEVLLDAQKHLYKLAIWQVAGATAEELDVLKGTIEQRLRAVENRVEQLALERMLIQDNPGTETDLSALQSASRRYVHAAEQAVLLIERNPIVGSTAARGAEYPYALAANAAKALAKSETESQERDLAIYEARSNTLARYFVLIAGALAIAVIAFAIFSAKAIAVPIRQLAVVFNHLASGRLNVATPCAEREDEVGEIAGAVSSFKDSLERNAILVDQLAVFHDRVTRECLLASEMQQKLLPQAADIERTMEGSGLEIASFYRASEELSGDLWGCRQVGPNQIGVYIVDFTGHGIAASLNTAQFHAMLQNAELDWHNPADLLQEVNRRLCATLSTGTFATMLYGVCDTSNGQFRYASAGAPRPLHGHAGYVESVSSLESSGLPVGVTEAVVYEERVIAMEPGSFVLLYSDALIETPNPVAPCFDLKRLIAWVSIEAGQDRITQLVPNLSANLLARAGGPLQDDLTMVCLKYAPETAKPCHGNSEAQGLAVA